MVGSSIGVIEAFVSEYEQHVRGIQFYEPPIKKFVGIEFEEDEDFIYLSQNSYVTQTVLKDRPASTKTNCTHTDG